MVEQNSRKMLKESKRGNNSVIFVVVQMDTRQLNIKGSWYNRAGWKREKLKLLSSIFASALPMKWDNF